MTLKVKSIAQYEGVSMGVYEVEQRGEHTSLMKFPQKNLIEEILMASSMKSIKSRSEREEKAKEAKRNVLESNFSQMDIAT